mgnify:CR=1 FL=1
MAVTFTWRTSAATAGGMNISRMHRAAAQEDLGFRVERLISAMSILQSSVSMLNALGSAVCAINIALGSAATSMAGTSLFSAFSAFNGQTTVTGVSAFANVTAWSSLSNFRASNPA